MTDLHEPASHPSLVIARCEGCELIYEFDVLGAVPGDQFGDCRECGSPVYVIDPENELFLAGYGAGWDAAVAMMTTGQAPAGALVPPVVALAAAAFDAAACGCVGDCDCGPLS